MSSVETETIANLYRLRIRFTLRKRQGVIIYKLDQ